MKKQRKTPNQKLSRKNKPTDTVPEPKRRDVLKLARNGVIATALAGGVGVFSVNAVRATVAEHDLSRVGKGVPTVVQIHDPQCSMCTALQRETRKALRDFEDDQITYLVANITTIEGSSFAARYGVPHVTLLMFSADGQLVQTLNGPRQRGELRDVFGRHIASNS